MKKIICLSLSIMLMGCIQEKTIDSSSQETFEESTKKIHDSLSEAKQKEYAEALQAVLMSQLFDGSTNLFELANKDPDTLMEDAKQKLNGKSAGDVISMAANIKQSFKENQLKSINEEIKVLKEKKETSDKTSSLLNKIVVSEPKFYWSKGRFSSDPTIDFKIKNNTDIALLRVSFHGVVASPNRTIPWVSDDFNYEFKGGLEPNEEQHLKLAPNIFGDWGVKETKSRDDLVMTIAVKNAENADKEEIISTFDEDDEKRLKTLLSEKQKLLLK